MKVLKPLAIAMAVSQIVACTPLQIRSDVKQSSDRIEAEASSLMSEREQRPVQTGVNALISDRPYVDVRPVARLAQQPSVFHQEMTFNNVPLQVLSQRVQAMTGIRLTYQSELVLSANANTEAAQPGARTTQMESSSINLQGLPPISQAIAAVEGNAFTADRRTGSVSVSFSGPLVELLNEVASATGSQWEYEEGARTVNFFRYKTAFFRIPAVRGAGETSTNMGGRVSAGSGEDVISSASANATHVTKDNVWETLDTTIKALISPEGTYAISPITRTVIVRDRPDRVETIKSFVDDMIAIAAMQVELDVRIYRVTVDDSDARGMNWNVAFQQAVEKMGFLVNVGTGNGLMGDTVSRMILSIPELDKNGQPNRFAGSEGFYDALASLGNVAQVQNASVTTSNNNPAPVKVVRRTRYLKETTQNYAGGITGAVSSGPTLTPGMEETGLNMYLLPAVESDGKRLLLKMMMSLSTLERMDTYGNDMSSIQLPQTTAREFSQEAWLQSGQMLVISGFEQEEARNQTDTPWGRHSWFFGGSNKASKTRERVVVTVRPNVVVSRSTI